MPARPSHSRSRTSGCHLSLPFKADRESFCRQILEIFEVFISEPVFTKDWLVMDMAKNDVVLDTIQVGMVGVCA